MTCTGGGLNPLKAQAAPLDRKRVPVMPIQFSAFRRAVERVSAALFWPVLAIAFVCFVGMLFSAIAQVIFRYVLEISVDWTEELARTLFTVSMMLGIALAVRERQHISVSFIIDMSRGRAALIMRITIHLCVLAFLVYFTYGAVRMSSTTLNTYLIALDWLNIGWLYAIEAFAGALAAFYVGNEILLEATRSDVTPRDVS